jgi:hypothetical protein
LHTVFRCKSVPAIARHLSVLVVIGSSSGYLTAAPQAFRPVDLDPDFYADSVATFTNPLTNAECVGFEEPNYCCTGPGTGTCNLPVESFTVADCTTRNLDCTGAGTPDACCSGYQSGSCCYEESDMDNDWQGNTYCPTSVCSEGCVNQWVDQSGYKSFQLGHPITGRTLEQDDLEKPCYQSDCLNGHACLTGHPAWVEPGYPANSQPHQDATLEIEPADRTGPFAANGCPGPFYIAQLVRIVPQSENHRLLAGFTGFDVHDNQLYFAPFGGGWGWSVHDVLPELDVWYLIEWQRDGNGQMRVWVNEQDRTPTPQPSSSTNNPFSVQQLCNFKDCTAPDNEEFQGDGAMLLYKCGPPLTLQARRDFYRYLDRTFEYK